MGRTWTVLGAVPTLLQVIAPPVGAMLVRGFSIGTAFACGGTGLVLLSALTFVRRRTLERPAAEPVVKDPGTSFETTAS